MRQGSRWAELGKKCYAELRRVLARPKVAKTGRVVLFSLVGVYLLYLGVANALLKLGVVPRFVNDSTDDARLELADGHSWFPGRVHVEQLSLRFEDANVQFEIAVARARGTLDLLALARKRLHFHELEADGVRFLFRHKVTSVAGNERRLVHFPRITGFSDPPILKPTPPSDKTKNWAIELENVRARAVELWFMEYRYTGNVEVTGGFELVPGRRLSVGPARATFTGGALGVGAKRPLATGVRSGLDFVFHEANPDPIPGLEIFRQISAKLALDAELVDLEAINLYLTDASGIAVRRGKSKVEMRLELEKGRFSGQSLVRLKGTEEAHVVLPNAVARGRLDVEARAEGHDARARLAVTGSLEGGTANLGAAAPVEPADISLRNARVSMTTDNADVTRPWKLVTAALRAEGGEIRDVRVFTGAADRSVLEGGAAWFFANAELAAKGTWTGGFRVDARGLRVRVGERRSLLEGSFTGAAESSRRDLESGTFWDVTLALASAAPTSAEDRFALDVKVPRVDWDGFPPDSARGRADLSMSRIEPLLKAVDAPDMLVSLWPDAPVEAEVRFGYEDETLDVRLDRAVSGPFRANGRLKVCSAPRGSFVVKSGAFSVGLSVRDGGIGVVPLASSEWLARNTPTCPSPE